MRFPKKLAAHAKWLNACGLTANDDTLRIYLCTKYFKREDICGSNIFGSVKSTKKRDAVPTLNLTNPLIIKESNESSLKTPLSDLLDKDAVAKQSSSSFSYSDVTNDRRVLDTFKKSSEKCMNLRSTEKPLKRDSFINTISYKNALSNLSRKHIFFQPHHVSKISLSHFSTIKRANRTIQLIKKIDQGKSHKVKQLQTQTRNLLHQVKSLEDLINHLKKKHILTFLDFLKK